MKTPVVTIDPEIMGGTPCFSGTRVPVQTLLDYLEAGDSIHEFLDGFPSVSKAQVVAYLEESKELIIGRAALGALDQASHSTQQIVP